MAITLNAKGTSTSSFIVGKDGTTITQGGVISPPADTDLTIDLDAGKTLVVGPTNISGVITTSNNQDLHINPSTGGGQYLFLNENRWPDSDGTSNQVLKTNGSGVLSWTSTGSGSVTDVSVETANGFAGSVATSTSTPAITLSTTVTGVLKGNGTAISAAASGDITTALGYTPVDKAGDTMTGNLIISGDGQMLRPRAASTAGIPGLRIEDNTGTRTLEVLSLGSTASSAYGAAAGESIIVTGGAGALKLGTNSTTRVTIGSAGNVTIIDPSSGTALTVGDNSTTGKTALAAGGFTLGIGQQWESGAAEIWTSKNTRIGTTSANFLAIHTNGTERISFESSGNIAAGVDNSQTFGTSSRRWSVIYAGTGTINTSDENEKTEIEELSAAELAVAVRIKGLIKKFKFKDAVALKGTNGARIHVGVIAQEVELAFILEGLDANRYGLFCEDTWEEDGETITRLGVRYDELLAFVIAAL